jgi:PDZ domain-containing protein/PEGA domain-containing protein
MRSRPFLVCGTALLAGFLALPSLARGQANDMAEVQVQMAEARRHFDALEYEQAVPALDRVIAILTTRRSTDTQKIVSDAYEMRARARFGLGDQNGAHDDFVALLRADPAHTLSGQISPRVVAMFEDAQKTTITTLDLKITPATAQAELDGLPVKPNTTFPIVVGEHTVTAKQLGYKPGSATFTAAVGAGSQASLELARSSAVVAVVTSPPDVEVFIDGVSKGKTGPGPAPVEYTAAAQRAGLSLAALSAPFIAADVGVGQHRVEFKRSCYVQAERRVDVTDLKDFVLDPVKLTSAIATVVASSPQPGASVFVDGESKGPAPFSAELCEGEHIVELRSQTGRFSKKVDVKPGQKMDVTGPLRAAFALVSASTNGPLNVDLRAAVERALDPVRSVYVFAPPADRVSDALKASQLPPDWLSFDANKRPLGVSGDITAPMRRDLSAKIAKTFDAQGIASVTIPSASNRNRVVVTLLGAGSVEPDTVEFSLDRSETIADAVTTLDRPIAFQRPSIGINVIDVADVAGAVVIGVDSGVAGIQAGDLIVKVNDQAVTNAAGVATALGTHKANDTLSLELKDKSGAAKKADVKVQMTPRVIGMSDQMLLANRLVADFRTQLLAPANAAEESIIRLNLAAALARLQAWSDARTELQKVKLPEGPGVGNGTVQYLLGLCADNLGNRAEAETAYKAAAASESWITEDGPPVKEMAEAKLADLQKRPAAR